MHKPKAILFDAGGTLVTIHPELFGDIVEPILGERPSADRMFDAHYLAMDAVVANSQVVKEPGWWKWWLGAYLGFAGLSPSDEATEALSATRGMWQQPIPGVIDAVVAIKDAGYRVAVVSNADGHVSEDLEAAGYGGIFETIVDSTRVGVSKPNPAIFTVALDALELDAAETWYVGDSPLFDLAGAANAGIGEFVMVDPFGLYNYRPQVATVTELPALLAD